MKCMTPDRPAPKPVVHRKKKLRARRLLQSASSPDKLRTRAKQQHAPDSPTTTNVKQQKRTPRSLRPLAEEDDRDLAADRNFALPSDNTPRLVRQESFRRKGASSSSSSHVCGGDSYDLYALGLLYDDEQLRGPGFNLDTIVHSEPLYSVRPAAAKRRKRRQHREAQFEAENPDLPLDLSFSSLGDDLTFARLLAPEADELEDADDDGRVAVAPPCYGRRRSDEGVARQYTTPLTVIYELEESWVLAPDPESELLPTMAEPPDLVSDGEVEEGEHFTLLGDEISLADDQSETESMLSVTAGDPWVMLGDGS